MPVDRDLYETVRALLDFDSMTGIFRWKARSEPRFRRSGCVAGRRDKDGYVVIRLAGKNHRAHRLAWLYIYGEWPTDEIDHVNGVVSDNAILNLREASRSQNRANSVTPRNNRSGYKGVVCVRSGSRGKKWRAQIKIDGRMRYLGWFDDGESAHAAYCEAAQRCFSAFACSGRRGG